MIDPSAWKRMSIGERINRLIEELRCSRYELFEILHVTREGQTATIALPEEVQADRAIVVLLTTAARFADHQ